jgi:NhaP-type Na+/H+ or K+/H+ antiporter
MYSELAVMALFVFGYSLVAGRLERAAASGPIVFVTAGLVMGPLGFGWFDGSIARAELRFFADVTLASFLFLDAANANLRTLRQHVAIPSRMLLIALPAAILLGAILAGLFFEQLSVFEAAILGTMLAATDAALGKPVITNEGVPPRIREGLNVESGLNDGLCVPILLVFIAFEVESGLEGSSTLLVLEHVGREIGIGLAVGLGLTFLGFRLLRSCAARGWVTEIWMQVTPIALAVACFAAAQSLHGSGYVAAFTGGMLFGALYTGDKHKLVLATEGVGETLALLTWFLFGAVVIMRTMEYFSWVTFAYALLSLTVVRMLPVYLSLAGTGETVKSKLFLGWFGPRGLASIVFAIIVVERDVPHGWFMGTIVVLTVLLSLVAHGVTANPLARRMARA